MVTVQDQNPQQAAADTAAAFASVCPDAPHRVAARRDMTAEVMDVLDVTGALTVTTDLPRANAYPRGHPRVPRRTRVKNNIWMALPGGSTAHSNATDIFRFLGRGSEAKAL